MWPRLVPTSVCRTPCKVVLTAGEDENCAPVVVAELELKCNYQDSPRQVLDAQRRLIQLGGVALFSGDIAPTVDVLAGTMEVYGRVWTIYRGTKCRDMDGGVNFTKLELM